MSDAECAVTPPSAQDYERMMSMVTGFWVTQIVRAAAVLNVADHIGAGRSTAAEIAQAESADSDAMRRLLRSCASLGLVTTQDGDHYAGTSLPVTLRRDSPSSLRGFAASQAAPGHWLSWGKFRRRSVRGPRRRMTPTGPPSGSTSLNLKTVKRQGLSASPCGTSTS